MKIKTTKKEIKKAYNNIITISYCNGWYLLQGIEPDFYTCGVYGWNEDIYIIDYNTIITTGYRPIDGVRDYELTTLYNEKARLIFNDYTLDYKKKLQKIEKLRNKYINIMIEKLEKERQANEK